MVFELRLSHISQFSISELNINKNKKTKILCKIITQQQQKNINLFRHLILNVFLVKYKKLSN